MSVGNCYRQRPSIESLVSDKCMATIAPSGQLVLAMLGMEQQIVTLRSCRALEGITGDEGRQLWEFHLVWPLNESHGQMIQALWRFYAMLPPGGLRRFSLGILRDRRFITGFYRGRRAITIIMTMWVACWSTV